MFFKNWLLLGCPFAPVYGCQNTVWAGVQWAKQAITVHNRSGVSVPNLFAYPFVWTFSLRKDMLGNVSPLLLGFVPLWFLYKRVPSSRSGYIAGWAGLLSVITWWLVINQLFPYPRWILVPIALLAICVSGAVAAAENDPEMPKVASWLVRTSIFLLLLFLAFQSRGAVYGIRYLAGIDSREVGYRSKPGFDVATWLNAHLIRGERVAFAGWNGFVYFVNPDHVLNSESANDLEALWHICRCVAPEAWTPEMWRFYAERGFSYAVVSNGLVAEALAASVDGMKIAVAFNGREEAVLRIDKVANSSKAHVSLSHYA
jgi:hypothetical protein